MHSVIRSNKKQFCVVYDAMINSAIRIVCLSIAISLLSAQLRHSMSVGALSQLSDDVTTSPWKSPETLVVKVYLEVSESHYSNMYKSIMVSASDGTMYLHIVDSIQVLLVQLKSGLI